MIYLRSMYIALYKVFIPQSIECFRDSFTIGRDHIDRHRICPAMSTLCPPLDLYPDDQSIAFVHRCETEIVTLLEAQSGKSLLLCRSASGESSCHQVACPLRRKTLSKLGQGALGAAILE